MKKNQQKVDHIFAIRDKKYPSCRYLARFSDKEDQALRRAAEKLGLSKTSFVRHAALLLAAKNGCFPDFIDNAPTARSAWAYEAS